MPMSWKISSRFQEANHGKTVIVLTYDLRLELLQSFCVTVFA